MQLISDQVGDQHYIQKAGISQGSVLSTLMCSLYYAHMEGSLPARAPGDVRMRVVDDYLYVTPNSGRAQAFLDTMLAGESGNAQ